MEAVVNDTEKAPVHLLAPSTRAFGALLLLALGVQCWIVLGDAAWGEKRQLVVVAGAAALCITIACLAPARRIAMALVQSARHPPRWTRLVMALLLACAAAVYLYQTARWQGRRFEPVIHDEHAYLVQSQMLARGRLWMPRHELGEFFDSFHLLTDRVYAAKYSPGTAMFCAPFVALKLPPWLPFLLLTGLSAGLLYLLLCELIDGLAGILAAAMLPALPLLRRISIEVMSQAPMLFLALLALLAFVYWRKRHKRRWMVLIGLAVGWGMLTRPVDAVSIAMPLALGILLGLRHANAKERATVLGAGLLALLPFASIQLIYNKGLTGNWTTLPWSYYAKAHDPYDTWGKPKTPPDPQAIHALLPQQQKFIREFTMVQAKSRDTTGFGRRLVQQRLKPSLGAALPSAWLIVLLPLGAVAAFAGGVGRGVAAAFAMIFILLYTPYTFFLAHYAVVLAPAVILLTLLGWDLLARSLPGLDGFVRLVGFGVLAALTITAYPQFEKEPEGDEWDTAALMADLRDAEKTFTKAPAIVLYRFDPAKGNPHVEPVYNTSVAWPDDAPIIRAQDLGNQKNQRLFSYYSARSPQRAVYLFDPWNIKDWSGPLKYLGTAAELAHK